MTVTLRDSRLTAGELREMPIADYRHAYEEIVRHGGTVSIGCGVIALSREFACPDLRPRVTSIAGRVSGISFLRLPRGRCRP